MRELKRHYAKIQTTVPRSVVFTDSIADKRRGPGSYDPYKYERPKSAFIPRETRYQNRQTCWSVACMENAKFFATPGP